MYSEDSFEQSLPPRLLNATTAYLLGLGPLPSPNTQDVIMEVVDLKTSKKRSKHDDKKTTVGTAAEEFKALKEHINCHQHSAGQVNRWCYPSTVNLWARKIHDNEADYSTPPNCLNLDHLHKKVHGARASYATASASANLPHIHIHLPGQRPLHPITNLHARDSDSGGDTEPDSDYENDLTVAEVLEALHADYPMLNMPQYAEALTIQGIIFATSVFDFDMDFYADVVKMAPGAGEFLIHQTKKELEKRRSKAKGKKRVCVTLGSGDESDFDA